MIVSVDIWGFQRHERMRLVPGPGVTTIVGDTEAGKSSVIRAIIWACRNEPSGESMIRHGAGRCKVAVKFHDAAVMRSKGRQNAYRLGRKKFIAFGQSVPEEVVLAVNMDDVNFQGQHDGAFWISDTPGKVSRELNRIVNLEVIDRSLANAARMLRDARAEHDVTKKRSERASEALSALQWVPGMLATYDALASRITRANGMRERTLELEGLVGRARELSERSNATDAGTSAGRALLERCLKVLAERKRVEGLCGLIERVKLWQQEIRDIERSSTQIRGMLDAVKKCPTCGSLMS